MEEAVSAVGAARRAAEVAMPSEVPPFGFVGLCRAPADWKRPADEAPAAYATAVTSLATAIEEFVRQIAKAR